MYAGGTGIPGVHYRIFKRPSLPASQARFNVAWTLMDVLLVLFSKLWCLRTVPGSKKIVLASRSGSSSELWMGRDRMMYEWRPGESCVLNPVWRAFKIPK